jgi:hypothetical protein
MSAVAAARRKQSHQINVQVAKPVHRLADGLQRRHWLPQNLRLLALLAIPTPGRHLSRQAGPHELADNEPSGHPDAWVVQAVNSVENWPSKDG